MRMFRQWICLRSHTLTSELSAGVYGTARSGCVIITHMQLCCNAMNSQQQLQYLQSGVWFPNYLACCCVSAAQDNIALYALMHACSLSSLASNTCSKSSIAPGYCADFCAFRWMITRSTQRIATARLHHFQCHVIALLCLLLTKTRQVLARIMLVVASTFVYNLQKRTTRMWWQTWTVEMRFCRLCTRA